MLLCIILPNFKLIPEILKELEPERRPSDLVKKDYHGTRKNWPSIAILHSDMLHVTVHHLTKFQANSLNP